MKLAKIISLVLCDLSLVLIFVGILSLVDNDDSLIGWVYIETGMICMGINIGFIIALLIKGETKDE